MKKSIVIMGMILACAGVHAFEITNVVAKQRYPWNGKLDISYEVKGAVDDVLPNADYEVGYTNLVVSATAAGGREFTASALEGDVSFAAGTHRIVWDLGAQAGEFKTDALTVKVAVDCQIFDTTKLYCIVDLSGGASAECYPVTYLRAVPAGGWTDEYKTTKLVLRRIDPGTVPTRDCRITKPFYIGVFQVTQKQYQLVTGNNPSYYNGDSRPVEHVSWNTIRGNSGTYNWPNVKTVDPNSFVGRLQAKTGLHFDLPTEAQWEYACRAGTTSDYNNGGSSKDDLKTLGRYDDNRNDGKGGYSEHTTVGSYLPNAWGLYDMHGNVREWCLDWYGGTLAGDDPVGASSGSYRVLRGGSWDSYASYCASSDRSSFYPSFEDVSYGYYCGFRVSCSAGSSE